MELVLGKKVSGVWCRDTAVVVRAFVGHVGEACVGEACVGGALF